MLLKVAQIKKESGNAFSIIFKRPENFRFYPGQYLNLGKEFTIASSPLEDFLMITTKYGISNFKKKLEQVKVSDSLESDHPAGTFTIDESDPAVFLAGGIGITPFRSMIKWAVDRKLNLPTTLIYSNSDSDFIFKKELDKWQKQLPKLTIHYINTAKAGRLTKDKLKKLLSPVTYNLLPIYYLAGPPSMVDDFEEMLLKMGVDETSIRTDRFDRY